MKILIKILYQYTKNLAISSIRFRNYSWFIDPRIWLAGAFWSIFQEADLYDLYRNISNKINFHYKPNTEQTDDQISR